MSSFVIYIFGLLLRFMIINGQDVVWNHGEEVTYGEGEQQLTAILVTNTINAIDATIIWNDQGWGNQKGHIFMRISRDGSTIYSADIFGIAPHSSTQKSVSSIQCLVKDIYVNDLILLVESTGTGLNTHTLTITSFTFNIYYGANICPTWAPTHDPTNDPTADPTKEPSNAPSYSPSNAPSYSPTTAPSYSPTDSPTACIDYNLSGMIQYNSNDGIDNISSININGRINESFIIDLNDSILYYNDRATADDPVPYFDELITCNSTDDEICYIQCLTAASCIFANIATVSEDLQRILLECDKKQSCRSTVFNYTQEFTPYLHEIVIKCGESSSCNDMTINSITHNNLLSNTTGLNIMIYCLETLSCQSLQINQQQTTQIININIICYQENSCKNLNIVNENNDDNVNIKLWSYEYSEFVSITTQRYKSIDIECGNVNDSRFIRYDTWNLLNSQEFLLRARKEYTSGRLPCEQIAISCLNEIDGKLYDQQCTMKYELSDSVDIGQIINSNRECFWIDINMLYNPICDGTCGQNIIIYEHPINIELELEFGINADDEKDANEYFGNDTISETICDQYFGDINATQRTLSDIDAILGASLQSISKVETQFIHGISKQPHSFLNDNKSQINCDTFSQKQSIKSNFIITSASNESDEINRLFNGRSTFMNVTNLHFKRYFTDISIVVFPERNITFNVTNIIYQYEIDEKQWWFWWVVIGVPLVIFVLVLVLLYYIYHNKKQRESKTIWIQNPMVIAIAMEFYKRNPDLHAIDTDLRSMHNLFKIILNYKMFPSYNASSRCGLKLEWTRKEIIDFLSTKAKELNDNLESNDLQQNAKYDGLVVVISGHGIEHHIISSDEKEIEERVIHRIFSGKYPKIRGIPRVFIYDSCSGVKEKNRNYRGDSVKNVVEKTDIIISEQKQEQFDKIIIPETWERTEQNPDFLLMTMRASNIGYQSKMNLEKGSYFIWSLYQKIKWNVETKNNKYFLGEIFEKIQSNLHQTCQLPEITANNGSQYIKFRVNKNKTRYESDRVHVVDDEDSDEFKDGYCSNKYMNYQQIVNHHDDEKSEENVNTDPLEPVLDTVVKYDELNKDIPDLGRHEATEMQELHPLQSTCL